MCGPDDRLFSGAQRCYAILEPSACDAIRACEETVLRCMSSVCGCIVCMSNFDHLDKVFSNARQNLSRLQGDQMLDSVR